MTSIDVESSVRASGDSLKFPASWSSDAVQRDSPHVPDVVGDDGTILPWVYLFNAGIEAEAAGRDAPLSSVILRRDLATLPFVLAKSTDIVLAPQQRPAFVESLKRAGFSDIAQFLPEIPKGRQVAGHRPFGLAGEHIRRSNVVKLRQVPPLRPCGEPVPEPSKPAVVEDEPTSRIPPNADVTICRSLEDIDAAVAHFGPRIVIKAEFSAAGQGCRFQWDKTTRRWAANRLRQDGCVTVEQFMDIELEVSGEFLNGDWNGCSLQLVDHGRWCGQYLGDPRLLRHPLSKDANSAPGADRLGPQVISDEVYDFVYQQHAVERKLLPLNVPGNSRAPHGTCGCDVAIVRRPEGHAKGPGLEVRILEQNARTTMAHYAAGAARRYRQGHDARRASGQPDSEALLFDVSHLSELTEFMVPLTDPAVATEWCAVLHTNCRQVNGTFYVNHCVRGCSHLVAQRC